MKEQPIKKLKIQMNGRSDEFQTPKEGFEILEPYIKKGLVVWECAYGGGESF